MATFGRETTGGTGYTIDNDIHGDIFTLSEAGDVSKITAYLSIPVDNVDNQADAKCAIYDSSDNFIAETTATTVSGQTATWYDFTFASPESLTAADYYLVAFGDDVDTDQVQIFTNNNAVDSTAVRQSPVTYPTFPDPLAASANNYEPSIYATYTATASTRRVFNIS